MATLFSRDGQLYVNYTLNGRRVRKSVSVDKEEAEIYLQELKYRLLKGDIRPDRPKIPVNYVIIKYLDDKANTINHELTIIRALLNFAVDND